MSFPNPFTREFWVMPEPPEDVIRLNSPAGRANAAQAAMSLEDDREAVRLAELRSDLMRQRANAQADVERIDRMLDEVEALQVLERRT